MYTIVESHIYTKMASAILTQDEQEALATFIAMQPESGDVIPHSGSCRKLRWQRQGMGRRGGRTTHGTLFNPFGYSRFRATSCTLRGSLVFTILKRCMLIIVSYDELC